MPKKYNDLSSDKSKTPNKRNLLSAISELNNDNDTLNNEASSLKNKINSNILN